MSKDSFSPDAHKDKIIREAQKAFRLGYFSALRQGIMQGWSLNGPPKKNKPPLKKDSEHNG